MNDMYGSGMTEIFEFDEVVFEEWWMNESWMYEILSKTSHKKLFEK